MAPNGQADVVVLGGGIAGLAVAWRARRRGLSVTLLERGALSQGASRVAAGMIAPVAEVEFGAAGRRVLELGLRSAAMWPSFAEQLSQASGVEVALQRSGTLLLARDGDEARELERQLEFRRSLGLAVRRVRASQARELEPALAPTVRLALEAPHDHSLDPRAVLAALAGACAREGVRVREHAPVERLEVRERGGGDGGVRTRVTGVRTVGGELLGAATVIIATGAWSGRVPLPAGVPGVPVRPVKGQILRLRDPRGPGLVSRVLRYDGGYVVPRGDGRYVLGATVEERGFELSPTFEGVHRLLDDAQKLVPGLAELEIEELCVGLRPGTPDNVPVVGAGACAGLLWATGHYRNGILLAPLTAELLASALVGEDAPDGAAELLAACSPLRFGAAAGDPPTLRQAAARAEAVA